MAKVFIEEATLTAIGDAIRGKEGSTDLIPTTDMATRIEAIESGGVEIDPDKILSTTVSGDGFVHLSDVSEVPHDITIQAAKGTKVTVVRNNLFDIDRFTMEKSEYSPYTTAWRRRDNGINVFSRYGGWQAIGSYISNDISDYKNCDLVISATMTPIAPVTKGTIAVYTADENNTATVLFEITGTGNMTKEFSIPSNSANNKLRLLFYASRGEALSTKGRNEVNYSNIYVAKKEDVANYTVDNSGIVNGIQSADNVTIIADAPISVTYNKSYGKYMVQKTFWDNYLTYATNNVRTDWSRAFMGAGWGRKTFTPTRDVAMQGSASYAFAAWCRNDCELVDLKWYLDRLGVKLDTSQLTDMNYFFDYNQTIGYLPAIDVTGCSTGSKPTYVFNYMQCLREIEKIIVNENTNYTGWFVNCKELEEVRFEGDIAQAGLNLQWSTKLSKASIENIINALKWDSGNTVTLSRTAVDNAFEPEEWDELLSSKGNWTISLV